MKVDQLQGLQIDWNILEGQPGDRHPYRDAWTERGAHLLLQTQTRVLNGEWDETFRRWYPQFRPERSLELKAAA